MRVVPIRLSYFFRILRRPVRFTPTKRRRESIRDPTEGVGPWEAIAEHIPPRVTR